eukprot:SAG25_NODE_8755_length_405_cov_1.905229_1_plen_46_part_10
MTARLHREILLKNRRSGADWVLDQNVSNAYVLDLVRLVGASRPLQL